MFRGREFPRIHDRPSILSFIRGALDISGCLPDPACALPDEKPLAPGELGWMAGAFDGVLSHHMGGTVDAHETAPRLAQVIVDASVKPRWRQLAALYEELAAEDVLSFMDPAIEALAELRPPPADIAALGTWLASESPDRNPVKVGIALLGITGAPDGTLLHQLGAHEEFTLYAVVAFCNPLEKAETDLVELAKRVRGSGRIHRAGTLGDLLTIHDTVTFWDRDDWDDRLSRGAWTVAERDEIRSLAARLLDRPRWAELTRTGLESDDPQTFWQAERAARVLGIDPFDQLLERIDGDPLGGPRFQAWQGVDRSRAEVLVDRASRLLDPAAIASGPSTAIGIGPEFKPHAALGWTLQGLREHPGLGADIISAAMVSPSIQNRNGALNLLEATPAQARSGEHRQQLEYMAAADPDDKVRQRAADLLAIGEAH